MDPTILVAIVSVTGAAVVLQALIMVALYLAVRRATARLDAIATEVKDTVLPVAETAKAMFVEVRPKIESSIEDIRSTISTVHAQVERIDATLADAVDRLRLQVIRADELVNHTMDRVEQTGDMVHRAVVSPVKQISGLVRGVSTGFEVFFGNRRRRRNGNGSGQEQMFI